MLADFPLLHSLFLHYSRHGSFNKKARRVVRSAGQGDVLFQFFRLRVAQRHFLFAGFYAAISNA